MTSGALLNFFQSPESLTLLIFLWTSLLGNLLSGTTISYLQDV